MTPMFNAYQLILILTADETAGFNACEISTKTMTIKH
jgi:hypothetical protein